MKYTTHPKVSTGRKQTSHQLINVVILTFALANTNSDSDKNGIWARRQTFPTFFFVDYFKRDLEVAGLNQALDDLTTHSNDNIKKRSLIILTRIKAQKIMQDEGWLWWRESSYVSIETHNSWFSHNPLTHSCPLCRLACRAAIKVTQSQETQKTGAMLVSQTKQKNQKSSVKNTPT